MFDLLKPFLARIAGSLIAGLAAFLSAHEIIVLTQNDISALVSTMLVVFGIVYSIAHKLISKKTNPGDIAVTPSKAL